MHRHYGPTQFEGEFVKRTQIMTVPILLIMLLISGSFAKGQTQRKWKFPPTINAPWALEDGQQPVDIDSAATGAGLCRSAPFNTLFAYAPLGASNVDAIVGDRLNNSGFSNFGCTTPQNETTIAVNPKNPKNLIAGANDYRVCCNSLGLNDATGWAYYSFDGGATWKNVQLPGLTAQTGGSGNFKLMDSAGDPAIAFSPDGVAYYATTIFSRLKFPAISGVAVNVSTDGGQTWSAPNMVSFVSSANFFNDKDWIAAGENGKVVVTWTQFFTSGPNASFLSSPIVGAISHNFGQSWNRQGFPISDTTHPFNQGSQVRFGPDGALYVAYLTASPSTGFATDAIALARSTDDGLTFETKELARVYDDLDCYPNPTNFAGFQSLTDMHFRVNPLPAMSVDPVSGEVALVWTDNQGSGTCGTGGFSFNGTTSNQVKLLRGSWAAIGASAVTKVTSSAPDKVFPGVASWNGNIVVTYYTRDYGITSAAAVCHVITNSEPSGIAPLPSANSVCLDYAAKTSGDGFAGQARLSTESSNPFVQFRDGRFIGDYSQVAVGTDGVFHAAWTDFRGNPGVTPANQDVVVATVPHP